MKQKRAFRYITGIFLALMMMVAPGSVGQAGEDIRLVSGQTVYVPIYTHIYSGLKGRPFDLAATLSIRNTDPKNSITIVFVEFYNTEGKLIENYLDTPLQLGVLASTRYVIKEGEKKSGGSGANFMVTWKSDTAVTPPIIEAIMIGAKSGQGISFVSRGQVVKEQ
jgi:hypothetical protein